MIVWIIWNTKLEAPFIMYSDCNLMPVFFEAQDAVNFLQDLNKDILIVKAVEL